MDEQESLGKYLKRERELRNISLRDIARNTKVKEYLLKGIEEDQYAALPSSTYVKGFLLSYAKYIGLDPNDILLRFENSLKGKTIIRPEASPKKKILWNIKYQCLIGGIIGISLLASYFFLLRSSTPPMESNSLTPTAKEPLPSPPQIPALTSHTEEQPFSLHLKAVEETWIRIQINGQPDLDMILKPGQVTSHQGLKQISLLVGNAGGLDIVFQGRSLERFGKSGEVANLIFTPRGVEVKRFEKPKPKPE